MSETRLAWHFVGDTLRDGRPIPADGEWLELSGKLELCIRGLHASPSPLNALRYAPGNTLCRVQLDGKIIVDDDKMVASRRRIIWHLAAEPMLWAFARWCALQIIHLWDAPEVVVRYLRTGDPKLRDAARDAARDAVRTTAWDPARDAARATASWAAARATPWWEDAWATTWDVAKATARATARDATRDAARGTARDAAMDAQNKQLCKIIKEARNGKTSWVFKEPANA